MVGKRRKRAYHRRSTTVRYPAFFICAATKKKPRLRMAFCAGPNGQPAWKAWLADKSVEKGGQKRFWALTITIGDRFKEDVPWKATLTMALDKPSFECAAACATQCHHAAADPVASHDVQDGLPADYVASFMDFFRIELDDPLDIKEESVKGMTSAFCRAFPGAKGAPEREVLGWAKTQRDVDLRAAKAMREILAGREKTVA
jgi:hypothetical protein